MAPAYATRARVVLRAGGALFAALVGTAGCKSSNLLSTSEEVRIGQEGARQIEQQYHVETGTAAADRVKRIGDRLLAHVDQRPGVPYSFNVLDRSEINAVSLPGGPVYVYKGLLGLVGGDDDELACVIAHELGHLQARHAAKMISAQVEESTVIQLLVKGQTGQALAGLGTQLLNLNYSRADEYEADKRGLSYAYKAGFDPRGLVTFFQKLEKVESSGGTPEFLRTHPLTQSRIDRARTMITNHDYPYGH